MHSEEIDYDKWRKVMIRLQLIAASFIFLIELVDNICLYVTRSQGYSEDNFGSKLVSYLLLPTIINFGAIICGYLLVKRLDNADFRQQYVLIFTLEIICVNVVLTHYQFGPAFAAVLVPILCCILYEDLKLSAITTVVSFLGATCGIVLRGGDPLYNQDIVGDAVIVYLEILAFFFMSRVIVSVLKKQREHLADVKGYEEKLMVLNELDDKNKELLQEQENLRRFTDEAILALSNAVEFNDHYTNGHSKRVAEYAKSIATKMGLEDYRVKIVYQAGLLHDVGKVGVANDIINKDGKLTDDEFAKIKLHPTMGYHILQGIAQNNFLADGARWHHERYDGKGYPDGLRGEDIPLVARIIAVADAYDAMTSNRSYRSLMEQEKVRNEIVKGRGTQFDPEVADIMLQMIDDDKDYNLRQDTGEEKRILIVDDDEMSILHERRVLTKKDNVVVDSAESAAEALCKLGDNTFDLILLDVTLPETDGFETFKMIRDAGYQMPVVFLSGEKNIESIEQAKSLGAMDYLTKPVLPDELIKVVSTILDNMA